MKPDLAGTLGAGYNQRSDVHLHQEIQERTWALGSCFFGNQVILLHLEV